MRKIALPVSFVFVVLLLGNALAVSENTLYLKPGSPAFSALERSHPSPAVAEFAFDLGLTNIGMETRLDWDDCPEFCEDWRFWVKVHNAGTDPADCARLVFTVDGHEIGRQHIPIMSPGEVRKYISPHFHVRWPEKCTRFIIDAHIDWALDENPDNDNIADMRYVSGHVDTCMAYDDGHWSGVSWLPGQEYPDYAMAAKYTFEEAGTVVYVEMWSSQDPWWPTGHVEFFIWADDPHNPGYPLEPPIHRSEYQLRQHHFSPEIEYVCFPVCLEVDSSDTYYFGYSNRQGTIQYFLHDRGEDFPDRNLIKEEGVWYTGPNWGGDWLVHPCLQRPSSLMMDCEPLTPIFCRGKSFYFKHTVANNSGVTVSGTLTFSGYGGYDCDPRNLLVAIPRTRTYAPGTTHQYYFFQVPSAAAPGQYSTSISGTLEPGGHDVFCCMNVDIIQCGPFRGGGETDWELVEIDRPDVVLPSATELYQNYPNPFNVETNISFSLAEAGNVSLRVYDIAGRLVETLVEGFHEAGAYTIIWDASDYSSGVYFYKLQAGGFISTKKMNLLK